MLILGEEEIKNVKYGASLSSHVKRTYDLLKVDYIQMNPLQISIQISQGMVLGILQPGNQ